MGTYTGCIIEESLKDKSILSKFKIVEAITDDGTSYIVEVDESEIDNISSFQSIKQWVLQRRTELYVLLKSLYRNR